MKHEYPGDAVLTDKHLASVLLPLRHDSRLRQAVKYISPFSTIKATRQSHPDGRHNSETFLVTCGAPNYYERRFIAQCCKAGEPFPVKKVQLKFYKEAK